MFSKTVNCIICADGGSDINLLPPNMFDELMRRDANVHVTKYKEPKRYGLATSSDAQGESIFVTCDKEVTCNVELFIRHGCYLELRNLVWYVATTDVPEPILGIPALELPGINKRELLAAAVGKLGSCIDMSENAKPQGNPKGTVARIMMHQELFHQDKGLEDDSYDEDNDGWLDLGIDTEGEKKTAIEHEMKKAVANGISRQGKLKLAQLLNSFQDVLRMRLGDDPLAKVEPMKVEVKENAKHVAAKARRYPPEGKKFMQRYVSRILE